MGLAINPDTVTIAMDDAPWTERVARDVARIALRTPTLPPATHTNCYLVGERDFVVVEPASPYASDQSALEAVIAARIDVGHRCVGALVTHHHVDHVGAAGFVRERFGVPLMAHARTRDRLAGRVTVDATLDDEAPITGLSPRLRVRALHTPGHAPGHLCLFADDARWMIAGDMIASVGTILIDTDDDGDMDAYLAQLGRMRALAPTRLLPAHGDPIDDADARLAFYIAHREAREARVLSAVAAGRGSLGDIVASAYDDTPVTLWPLAARSARAHLERLAKHQKVRREGDRWRVET